MALTNTDFNFTHQEGFYKGKVRDVYNIAGKFLIMIATDRISAFDVVLPRGIPYKGQVLNQIASHFLDATSEIVPNWKIATPDPNVTAGILCQPFKVEMVIRGYLSGHAWREYNAGKTVLCGVPLPEGMKEHQSFPQPIITPTTKAAHGHDIDISKEEILSKGLVSEEDYSILEKYTHILYKKGAEMSSKMGLILADTKYEFGKADGKIYLIDEIHTPDSSRYYYTENYYESFASSRPPKQLSKEFVRVWLMENGFQGHPGQLVPEMTDNIVQSISERYIELYEKITGKNFIPADLTDIKGRIFYNCNNFVEQLTGKNNSRI